MERLVLQTKLYIPQVRVADLVSRSRLIERLNEGLHRTSSVTLISAPAGFGKTTLVSEWVAGGERPAAWLSLVAYVRHVFTDYDELLKQDYDRESARFFVASEIETILSEWGVRRRLTAED